MKVTLSFLPPVFFFDLICDLLIGFETAWSSLQDLYNTEEVLFFEHEPDLSNIQ